MCFLDNFKSYNNSYTARIHSSFAVELSEIKRKRRSGEFLLRLQVACRRRLCPPLPPIFTVKDIEAYFCDLEDGEVKQATPSESIDLRALFAKAVVKLEARP
jgi:hypothetical protein